MRLIIEIYELRWILLAVAVFVYAATKTRAYLRLRQFKGPVGAGWFETWHVCAILSMRSHEWYRSVTDRYGTIARVGPNELITTSPELLAHMNAVRSPYTRAVWFNRACRVEPGKDHVFSQVDEEKHTKRRQQMASGYSGKENLALEPPIDRYVGELLNLIRTKYISTYTISKPMDLARKVQYFTLDVISDIGFGQAFGDLKADADVNEYIVSGEQGLSLIAFTCATGLAPILQWPPISRLFGPSEKDKSGHGKMMATARGLIDERLRLPTDKRSDMLASFIRHGLTKDDLFTEAMLQILAGSDTTATAIRSIMLYLMSHPRVYSKLQAEIDAAVASGSAPLAPSIISDAQAKTLPYLQAVVREGLRIHPPVTDVVPKVVPKGGDTVVVDKKQVFLPGGTNIGYCVLGLNRSKQIFGDDVEQFRPERWLLADDDPDLARLDAMKRTTEMIFGYGKYQCLGKPIAWMEINKAVFELMHHFDWAIARPEKPWRSTNYMGIFAQEDLWVLVTDRESNA